jgi:putative Mn2+ efflux pump MntP
MQWLPDPLILGLDSLLVSAVLAPLVATWGRRWRLAVLFGACDGLAVLIGSALAWSARADQVLKVAGTDAILAYGAYVMIVAFCGRLGAAARFVWLVPALTSFDNLAYGLATGAPERGIVAQALACGLASAALALLGLTLGSTIRFGSVRAAQSLAGSALVAIACIRLLG